MHVTRTLARAAAKAAAVAAATAALVAPALAAPAQAQLPGPITSSDNTVTMLNQQGCKPHFLVAVPGGANTIGGVPTFLPHGGQVFSTGLISQAASAGQIQPLWVSYNSAAFLTRRYPNASAEAYGKTWDTVAKLAQHCPNASFSLTGYSLGADVAARLTRDIAYGRGPIAAEKVDAVALIANPYQGGNGAALAPGTSPDSRGALGPLEGGYGQLAGKVLEICRPDDIVCSTDERFRPLVAPAMQTNASRGQVPAELGQRLAQLGPGAIDLAAAVGAHGDYGQAAPRMAADWIVSHTPAR
ncbi:cutinase family protein [Corynebacterium sp. TA-R-1]|uniref:Cutinase family protein n=1 Tax=Corynebacterium stercoris TaxID=2943490 RepID=A0ABT1G290_9CORY|nr:cutinase family protein [Corynebacterium stercoris]MCP1388141.1 cutinase family protein [Corynebacterium stercoris]